jgi:RNA polymerase sigma factor (sigma-70 family)
VDEANGDSGGAQAGPKTGDEGPSRRVPGQRDPIARPGSAAPDPTAPPAGPGGAAAPGAAPGYVPGPAPDPGTTDAVSAPAPADADRRAAEHPADPPGSARLAPRPSPRSDGVAHPDGFAEDSRSALSDTELVAQVRAGRDDAYEELYRRHAVSVRRYARSCCRDAHTAEDLTGEVFARTLQAIRGGSGPETAVRAYLLTTVRRVAASWGNTTRREQLVEDFAVFAVTATGSAATDASADLGADVRAMHEAERSLAIRAFRTLPERWQTVLWHTAVEDESPSEIAPLLGLTPNATAVLAHRAREGLRQAYLQAHVSTTLTATGDCARYADRLGAHARGGLRIRADRELNRHLKSCERCTAASMELADLNSALKGLLPVAYIGWFAAVYATKAAGIVVVSGAAAAAGAAGGAAAASGSGGAASSAGGAAAGEGLGAPVKVGIAAAVVVAAAATAFALTGGGGHAKQPVKPQAKPPASAPVASVPPPPPAKPAPKPRPRPAPVPTKAAVPPPSPRPTPTPTAQPTPTPTHAPPAKPKPPPQPTRKPTPPPVPPPPPAPTTYNVNSLPVGRTGQKSDRPTIRLTPLGSWWWDRWGLGIGGTTYAHGITVHAPSSLTIDLNRSCVSYDARAGVDDLVGPLRGIAVTFSVYGDSTRLWSSGPVHAGDRAVPTHVGIAGRKTIRLVVSPAGHGLGLANLADWADSVITCS